MRARPLPVTVAAILMVLFSLANLLSTFMPTEGVPTFVVYLGVVLGVVGLTAAAGLWMLRRWALWLTIVVSVLNILSGGSWVVLRAERRAAGCCHGYGGRLRFGHLAGGAAEFAADLHLTSFREP